MTNVVNLPGERLAGLVIDLHHKLKDGVRTLDELALFCQGKNPFEQTSVTKVWKTWKTIKLGTGPQTAGDFRKEVVKAGMKIGDWANDVLSKPDFRATTCETEVELVVASVAELGFKDGATRKDIYVRAEELGLDLCPPEVGPYLRLQYTDQPKGEWLFIATEPITDSGGSLSLFRVENDDGECWLYADSGNPDGFWRGSYRFVFLRRK